MVTKILSISTQANSTEGIATIALAFWAYADRTYVWLQVEIEHAAPSRRQLFERHEENPMLLPWCISLTSPVFEDQFFELVEFKRSNVFATKWVLRTLKSWFHSFAHQVAASVISTFWLNSTFAVATKAWKWSWCVSYHRMYQLKSSK